MNEVQTTAIKKIEIKHVATLGDQKYPTFELKAILSYLNQCGHGDFCAELLSALGLAESDLEHPFMDAHLALEALRLVLDRFDQPGLGCRIAQTYRLDQLGMIGTCLGYSNNLGDALSLTNSYYNLLGSFTDITNIVGETRLTNRLVNVADLPENIQRFLFELTVAGLIAVGQELSGTRVPVRSVRFAQKLSEHDVQVYRSIFQCEVVDQAKFDEWDLDLSFAELPVILPKPSLEKIIEDLQSLDQEWQSGKGLVDDIDDILQGSPGDYPDPAMVAHAMGVSGRTLRRKLNGVGITYSALMNKVRLQLVLDLLNDHDFSNDQIAETLGFSDTANFHHAFKKWTGKTPGFYRIKK
ncbi:AraC family transcriptional regulator [Litoribacillus peritrichatus]|uniref:Ornithine utilization transcriptional regulator OruR n=1 Tax=Litoribacillus peritrichatus TaxID=718191 RepID=A0ABP7M939_9GAMM